MGFILATVEGRLAGDPEVKTIPGGDSKVANISIAVNEKYKGEKVVTFINASAFGQTANLIEKYFKKGYPIACIGGLRMNEYTSKTGEKRISVNMTVDSVRFPEAGTSNGTGGNGNSAAQGAAPATDPDGFSEIDDDGDLPF